MASIFTKFGIPESFLTCGLCHETFRDPKQLPCLHSFCRTCLVKYIEEKSRESGLNSFPCLVCHKATKFRGTVLSDPVQWTNDFQSNYFILNLLQIVRLEIETVDDASKEHMSPKCTDHRKEVLQFYCCTCHVVLCDICRKHTHGSCHVENFGQDNVYTMCKLLQDEANASIDRLVETAGNVCQELIPKQRNLLITKEETAFEITRYYSDVRNKINQTLMRQEQALQGELDDIVEKQKEQISDDIGWCKSVMRTLDNDRHLLSSLKTEDTDLGIGVLKVLQEVNVQLNRQKKAISQIEVDTDDTVKVHFAVQKEEENKFLAPKLGSISMLNRQTPPEPRSNKNGHVLDTRTGQESSRSSPPSDIPVIHNHKDSVAIAADLKCSINFNSTADNTSTDITGLTWVGDRLLAVDRWSHKIKLFAETGDFLSSAVFEDGEPWDVTFTGLSPVSHKSFCYVTIPKAKKIHSVTITRSGAMNFEYEFSVTKGYTCLTYNKSDDNIVCGSSPPFASPCIEIIDPKGVVFASFAMDVTGHALFSYPRSINISDDGIIAVCDWNKNTVTLLRNDGFIVSTYGGTQEYPLEDPIGTSLDGKGNLFVSDNKCNKIFLISLLGQLVGVLQSDVELCQPRLIAATAQVNGQVKLAVISRGSLIQVFCVDGQA